MSHIPVLAEEVLRLLDPRPGDRGLDATIGAGGHAERILERILPGGFLLGIDRDEEAVRRASDRFRELRAGVLVVHENFANVRRVVLRSRLEPLDLILADLGLSSDQLDAPERGFSFQRDGPLDMRMSGAGPRTAGDLVNGLPEKELADLIRAFGEERHARRIARRIAERRPLRTTRELAAVVASALPKRDRIHPATRTFLALRIAVNDELDNLERFLHDAPDLLAPGGRLAVIAYHSLEDRRVKQAFRQRGSRGGFEILTRKPIRPSREEVLRNPRARSAKLRVLRRSIHGAAPGRSG